MSSATSAPAFGAGLENRFVDGFTSLLDEVDSEEIATRYDIGLHSNRIGFLEHVKIGLRLGIADPNILEDLAQQTDVYADLAPISKGHFSKLTARRLAQVFAELATAVLEHPSLYHPAGVARKRLEHLCDRQIIGSIENTVLRYDHSFSVIFLILLIANMRTISRDCRY